jgi:hypothetical protein
MLHAIMDGGKQPILERTDRWGVRHMLIYAGARGIVTYWSND